MTSAICLVNNQVLPMVGETGMNVAPGSTVTIALQNPAGVLPGLAGWTILCTNVDGYNPNSATTAQINNTLVINYVNFSATFTMPQLHGSTGSSLIFTSSINAGTPTFSQSTFGVFTLFSGTLRGFAGEEQYESNATVGCAYDLNALVAAVASGGGGSGNFEANGDLSGTNLNQTVVGIQGVPVASTFPSFDQVLQYNGTEYAPTTLLPGFIAGGDLSGSSTSQEVIGLLDHPLPSLADGYLNWTGTSWQISPISGLMGASIYNSSTLQTVNPMPTAGTAAAIVLTTQLSQNTTTTSNAITFTQGGSVQVCASFNGTRVSTATDFNLILSVQTPVETYSAVANINPVPIATNTYAFSCDINFVVNLATNQSIEFLVTDTLASGGSVTFGSVAGSTLTGSTITVLSIAGSNGPGSFIASLDLYGSLTSQEVVGLLGQPLPSLTTGYLNWNGSAWLLNAPSATGTAGGDLSGSYPNPTVIAIQGNPVASGTVAEGQFLIGSSSGHWSAETISGDVSSSISTPGKLTVASIDGYSITNQPTVNGESLTYSLVYNDLSWTLPSSSSFIYNLTAVGTNIYNTWSALMAAISANNNAWSYITLDGSGGALTVPSGSYNLDMTAWQTRVGGTTDQLTFQNGATFTFNTLYLGDGCYFIGNSSSIICQLNNNSSLVANNGAKIVTNSGKTPFFNVATTVTTPLFQFDQSSVLGDGTDSTVSIVGSGVLTVNSYNGDAVKTSAVSGTGTLVLNLGIQGNTHTQTVSTETINYLSLVGNLKPGTSAQILMNNATPTATWTSLTGDSTLSATGSVTNTGLQGNTFTAGAPTKGQFVVATSASNYGPVSLSGDLTESASTAGKVTVSGVDGYVISNGPTTGQVLEYNGTNLAWTTPSGGTSITGTGLWYSSSGALNSAAITLTGDVSQGALSGSNVPLTVVNIHGTSVPAGGSLTTGNQLIVSGASAATWQSLNLAGGANYVTGNLPISNVAPGTSAQILMSNGTPATTWTSMSGDVTIGATGVTAVGTITGSSNVLTVACAEIVNNSDGYNTVYQDIKQATTTNNSNTNIFIWTLPNNSVTQVDVTLSASNSLAGATTIASCWKISNNFKNDAGTVSTIGVGQMITMLQQDSGAATWVAAVTNSGTTGEVVVTGATGVNINWQCVVQRVVAYV